jgi:hypothetical protein
MARILVGDTWYEGLSTDAFLEGEFERLILGHAQLLFPEFHAVKFTRSVQVEEGIKKPDFALIDKNYSSWWIVEVELAHHSLWGHIIPQVSVFARAIYGPDDAAYLEQQSSELDGYRLREMMRGEQPRVLVIVNHPRPEWRVPLESYGALLSVAEVFRSEQQRHVIRLNGDYPREISPEDVITTCYFDPLIGRFLVVRSPGRLDVPESGRLAIEFEGGLTEWVRMSRADRVWLGPVGGRNPLPPGSNYELVRIEGERLMFRVAGDLEESYGDST